MNPLHCIDQRRALSPWLRVTAAAAENAARNAATLVSTHLREVRVGLPVPPTLVHCAVLLLDRLSALVTRDAKDK